MPPWPPSILHAATPPCPRLATCSLKADRNPRDGAGAGKEPEPASKAAPEVPAGIKAMSGGLGSIPNLGKGGELQQQSIAMHEWFCARVENTEKLPCLMHKARRARTCPCVWRDACPQLRVLALLGVVHGPR